MSNADTYMYIVCVCVCVGKKYTRKILQNGEESKPTSVIPLEQAHQHLTIHQLVLPELVVVHNS